jgi:hypothetical protein
MSWGAARVGAIVVSACALVGCITAEYGQIGTKGSPYGYSDLRNADGSYTIRVVAMHAAQAHEFWDRRAAEICGSASFRKNIFRAEIPVVTQSGYVSGPNGYGGSYTQDVYGNLIMEGYLHCEGEAQAAAAEPATESPEAPDAEPSGEAQQTQP